MYKLNAISVDIPTDFLFRNTQNLWEVLHGNTEGQEELRIFTKIGVGTLILPYIGIIIKLQ